MKCNDLNGAGLRRGPYPCPREMGHDEILGYDVPEARDLGTPVSYLPGRWEHGQ